MTSFPPFQLSADVLYLPSACARIPSIAATSVAKPASSYRYECALQTWKLTLAYDGSDFQGWQIQPGLPTIQGELQAALGRIIWRSAPSAGLRPHRRRGPRSGASGELSLCAPPSPLRTCSVR